MLSCILFFLFLSAPNVYYTFLFHEAFEDASPRQSRRASKHEGVSAMSFRFRLTVAKTLLSDISRNSRVYKTYTSMYVYVNISKVRTREQFDGTALSKQGSKSRCNLDGKLRANVIIAWFVIFNNRTLAWLLDWHKFTFFFSRLNETRERLRIIGSRFDLKVWRRLVPASNHV